MSSAPVPVSTPPKLLSPPLPVVSVAAPSATLPLPASVPKLSLPPSASVAPAATVTAGRSVSRAALPSVSVPPSTFSVPAATAPVSALLPVLSSTPAPSCRLAVPSAST